jgi:tetratricopeptide (TPR) repeat protein
MQELKSDNKLDIVETLSVIGSIGGAIASLVFNQIALASIPLSVSVALNLLNRRRLLDASSQSNQTAIAQIVHENFKIQEQVGTLTEKLTQLQQLTTKKNGETQDKVGTLTQQLAELQQLTTNLVPNQDNKNLNEYTQNLLNEQAKLANTVDCLREIETCSQTIRVNPNHATAYYNRGLRYERLGEQEAALGDYSEAIRLNPNYVEAYNSRGLAHAELGNKKGAVNDLRTSAKLFFEQGDIANYQIAKDFSKQLYEIESQPKTDVFSEVAVERLFA